MHTDPTHTDRRVKSSAMAAPTLREWLREEPFGLAMSSAFFGFFAHTGVMHVLEDEGLLPSRVSGSSAGALVTGLWAAGLDAPTIWEDLRKVTRADFWDPGPGFGLLRGNLFRKKLVSILGERTFAEGRVPAAVSVHDPFTQKTHVIDSGNMARALHASCAVPGLFHPVRIEDKLFVDGGVSDRPGLAGMPPGRLLFHHIPSMFRGLDPTARVPDRPFMRTMVLDGLPRSGPFKLEVGHRAYEAARRGAKLALDRRLHGLVVHVDVTMN